MNYMLHLENNVLSVNGATKVASSTHSQAVIECGDTAIVVAGNEIEVKNLNLEEGVAVLFGEIADIKFVGAKGKKQPLLKRIFK